MALEKSISFLKQIKINNNTDWMHAHKPAYQEARDEFLGFAREIILKLGIIDEGIAALAPKKSVFRINRDIRFTKDKRPYKNNFGMFLSEGGKKSGNAGYYFHLEPGDGSFLAGGVYNPNAERLHKIRQEIDYNPGELKKIVSAKKFQDLLGPIQGQSLKRAPKGYSEEHPNIDLLKLKSFIVLHKVDEREILNWQTADEVINLFKEIKPLNDYFNVAMS